MCTNEISKNLPPFLQKIKNGTYKPADVDYPIHCFLKDECPKFDDKGSDICNFLKGKSIFITGSTGFLGKLLVEKLLRACYDIESIILLVRPKKGIDENARLTQLLNDVVFERLEDMHPNFRDKIKVVAGDVSLPELGISESDRKLITDKVGIIYHVAATTRFDEHIKLAVETNINSTKEIIKLAKECKNLVSLLHVSTAYSNCNQSHIEEKFYKPLLKPEEIITLVENLSKEQLTEITPKLLGKMPNTYTLTKQIAENVVQTEAKNLPACVFRPSIVLSTAKEPVKAWTDNIFGPPGYFLGIAIGLIRCLQGKPENRCDLVPADYVINACIACSYETTKNRDLNKMCVYNFTSDTEDPTRWKDLYADKYHKRGYEVGTTNIIRSPYFIIVESYFVYWILNILYQKSFAYATDAVCYVMGKERRLVKGYQKIEKFSAVLSFFAMNEFDFDKHNVENLWHSLSSKDKKMFPFSMKNFDWTNYILSLIIGLRVYLLKENLDNLREGRRTFLRMYYIYIATNTIIYGLILFLCYKLMLFIF